MGFPNILVVIPNLFPLPSLSHFPFAPVSIYSYSIATPPQMAPVAVPSFLTPIYVYSGLSTHI